MFGLNTTELIVILIIALVIFGPNKLPLIGGAMGRSIREFKKSLNGEECEKQDESKEEIGGKNKSDIDNTDGGLK